MNQNDDITEKVTHYGELHRRIHETVEHRSESPEARAAWEQACRDFQNYKSPMEFIDTAEGRRRLRDGDAALLEYSIRFLELDPYVFRSGYAKAAIIRCIKRLQFSERQLERLRAVVLLSIDKYDRPEFRAYCRLAATVQSPSFIERVRERLDSPDESVRRRAKDLLNLLAH